MPPPDADDDGGWRAGLARRIVTVSGFLKFLTEVIEFGSNADGAEALAAMRDLPALLVRRRRLAVADTRLGLVTGWWKRLVFGSPPHPGGMVDKNAYVFCVLTEFHRRLLRRDIYAEASSRWRDPRAQLLAGPAWESARGPVMTALDLPADPGALLAGRWMPYVSGEIFQIRLPCSHVNMIQPDMPARVRAGMSGWLGLPSGGAVAD